MGQKQKAATLSQDIAAVRALLTEEKEDDDIIVYRFLKVCRRMSYVMHTRSKGLEI
jgi:hypothetical protein